MLIEAGVIGAFSGGPISKKYGRVFTIKWTNISIICGAYILSTAHSFRSLLIARFLIGIGAGIGTAIVPVYISEISTLEQRGSMGSMHQLAVTIGILFALALGVVFAQENWRLLLALTAVPCILQFCLLWFCTEPPKYF